MLPVNGIISPVHRVQAMGIMVQEKTVRSDVDVVADFNPLHRPQAGIADADPVPDPDDGTFSGA